MRGRNSSKEKNAGESIWDSFLPSAPEEKPQEVPSECLQRIKPLIKELFAIEDKIKNSTSTEEADHFLDVDIAIREKIKQASKKLLGSDFLMPDAIVPLLPDNFKAVNQAYLRLTGKERFKKRKWRVHPPMLRPASDYLETIKPWVRELSAIEDQIKKANSTDEVERLLSTGTEIVGRIARAIILVAYVSNPRKVDEPPRLFEAVNQAYIRITGKERPDRPTDEWCSFSLPGENE